MTRDACDKPYASARETRGSASLLTVAQLAEWLQVDAAFVYEHAAELGAYRLGSGPRARLRFDLVEVRQRLRPCLVGRGPDALESASPLNSRPRRRRSTGTDVVLLPIRGPKAASTTLNGGQTA